MGGRPGAGTQALWLPPQGAPGGGPGKQSEARVWPQEGLEKSSSRESTSGKGAWWQTGETQEGSLGP